VHCYHRDVSHVINEDAFAESKFPAEYISAVALNLKAQTAGQPATPGSIVEVLAKRRGQRVRDFACGIELCKQAELKLFQFRVLIPGTGFRAFACMHARVSLRNEKKQVFV
jgi:hypothetical protein